MFERLIFFASFMCTIIDRMSMKNFEVGKCDIKKMNVFIFLYSFA